MKRNTQYIERNESILTWKENLEHLYTLKDFPVFMGCVDTPQGEDVVADMEWGVCKDTGVIQLTRLIPLEILYHEQHAEGVGRMWQNHYAAFADFLLKFKPNRVLEIGGAHDYIANNVLNFQQDIEWTIIEPNPGQMRDSRIKVIKAWFDDTFTLDTPVDTVVHSHVFEHTYNPVAFIEHIARFLEVGQKHIFTFPNMTPMLEKKFTNCLNFEHTVFLTEEITEYILNKAGFKILAKEYYGDPHSIFYATEKVGVVEDPVSLPNQYAKNKELFMDYISYHVDMVRELNKMISSAVAPVYLFGAHIFSQTLIQFGLKTDTIVNILDNSPAKNGKRLYGTSLIVESPQILRGKGKVDVILKAGIYNEEIKKDILDNINPEAVFW